MIAVITDVKYKMALAIIRDLGEAGITVIACESDEREGNSLADPVGFHSKYVSEKVWLPNINTAKDQYMDQLFNVCQRANEKSTEACILIPIGAKTLQFLAEEETRERFKNIGLGIPTKMKLDFFNGKKEVAQLADELEVPVPKSYIFNEEDNIEHFLNTIEFPCVVKPNCGEKLNLKAAQRYCIIKDIDTLKEKFHYFYNLEKQPPIIQEYVAGAGYGISVLADEGKIIDSICHKRLREYPNTGGPSTCCRLQEISILEEYAKKIIGSTGYTGIAMIEFKRAADGTFKLLEINPRVWGTYPLTRVAKTKFTYNWFVLASNSINPQKLDFQYITPKRKDIKMKYFFADLRAVISYAKNKEFKRSCEGIIDLINPFVRDGVIEFKDIKASIYYIRSLFSRTHKKVD